MPTPPSDLQLMSRVVAVDEEIIGGKVGLSALLRSGWERTDRRLSPSGFFAK
jgi:hypothetical protein